MGRGNTEQLDLWKGFHPYDEQRIFLNAAEKYRLASSGYGSGKSSMGCRESIRHAIQYAGSRNFIGRLELKRLKLTTQVTLHEQMRKIGLKKGTHFEYNKNEETYTFKNGSVIILTQLDDEEFFGSMEASTIFVDEGSEVPDRVYEILFPSRLRWHLPDCPVSHIEDPEERAKHQCTMCPQRAWICTNPGASNYLRNVVAGKVPGWVWVPIPPGANPFVGDEYHRELEEKGKLYGPHWDARYRQGSWDAFEGQRFPTFDETIHVINDHEWKPSPQHQIVEGWDFGYNVPTAVMWIAHDPTGDSPDFVFDEYHQDHKEVGEIANVVKERRAFWGAEPYKVQAYGDPGGDQSQAGTGISAISLFQAHGVHIIPCKPGKSPGPRADLIAKLINRRHRGLTGEFPGLVIHRRCENLIRSLKNYRYEPDKGDGNASEKFVKDDDHAVDALGYGLTPIHMSDQEDGTYGSRPNPVKPMEDLLNVQPRITPQSIDQRENPKTPEADEFDAFYSFESSNFRQ